MPSWGMHLLVTKKLNEKLKVKDYNSFLIGNIITDLNNGYVIPNVSKVISHKKTHYATGGKLIKNGEVIYYDIEKFIQDNDGNIDNPIILGYITHLITDSYWNNLTYHVHGVRNNEKKLIGIKLNNGDNLIAGSEIRRREKVEDFKIFVNFICENKLIDIPVYDEKTCEYVKKIKNIQLTSEDIYKLIEFLKKTQDGVKLERKEYKIFTQEELIQNIDKCVEYIIEELKKYNINIENM